MLFTESHKRGLHQSPDQRNILRVKVEFLDKNLDRLEIDPKFTGGFPAGVVKAFRKRMQYIRASPDERNFYSQKSLHFEKLKAWGPRRYSMRLNDQYRLILDLVVKPDGKLVRIVEIWDHH